MKGYPQGFQITAESRSASACAINHHLTDLASTEDVQLLIHLCSNVAISSGLSILRRFSTLALSLPVNETSIRLRYSGISSRFGLSRPTRLRERGLYLLTPGTSREMASEAAAVIGFEWVCWVVRKWCEAEDEADEARMNGSKCSLRRSNSRLSGAESSYFWSWSGGVCIR
jgi:hypothetical protein